MSPMAPHRSRSKRTTPTPQALTLADLRRFRGLTQIQLAAAAGMDQSELSKAERRPDHRVSTLRLYVEAGHGEARVQIGGALVVPTAAASLDMAVEVVIEAFAVVVIGGLGSMAGALAGALLVGLIRAGSLVFYPEFEILAIYLIVIGVLLLKPSGLFGKPAA